MKQSTVALSTSEAEYKAFTEAANEEKRLRRLRLEEIGLEDRGPAAYVSIYTTKRDF